MVKLEDFTIGEIKKMVSKYNKQVKITTSGLKKADLIKKIREHPRLTVTENDKGVNIKVKSDTTMGGKKIKIKKDEEKPKAQLGQSGIGKKRKREDKPKKKKVIQVEADHESDEEDTEGTKPKPKPKVPTITVTEEEKPKKKVIKRGGRYITVKPKEPKADLPPIPKPKAKIRIAPKEKAKAKPKKEKAGPAEEKSEDLPKFTKVKPAFKEDTVESLTKAIKYHKKQGNDKIVNKLEKDLKKLKGKGKAKQEESDDEDDAPKINVKLLSAQAKVKSLKQQIKDLREEGKTNKRIEKELRVAELKLSKMKK